MPAARPTTPAELCALVAESRAAGRAVTPVGGGTQAHLGYSLSREAVPIDLTGLNRIIDYPARDLTVTAEAGVTAAKLAETLASEGQRLAIDIPQSARATLGGSVAANVSGPRRLRAGTLRDALIGVTFVTDSGELSSAGGRVVKNVAGYDLMKLHAGALGTLGILTQLTFKVTPIPEARGMVVIPATGADLAGALDRVHASSSRPALVELWHRDLAKRVADDWPDAEWLIVCGFEEKGVTVAWQVETLLGETPSATRFDSPAIWNKLADLPTLPESAVCVQLSVPPTRVAQTACRLAAAGWLVHAHALSGILTAHRDSESDLVSIRPPAPGSLAMIRGPEGVTRWSRSAAEEAVSRAIKRALDPDDVFNPGRLFRNPPTRG